jgi:hypothetical protein
VTPLILTRSAIKSNKKLEYLQGDRAYYVKDNSTCQKGCAMCARTMSEDMRQWTSDDCNSNSSSSCSKSINQCFFDLLCMGFSLINQLIRTKRELILTKGTCIHNPAA